MLKQALIALTLGFLAASCSSSRTDGSTPLSEVDEWMLTEDKLRVLSTIGMIGDIVDQIGGDEVVSLTLIHRELDPHTYELVKGDDEKLAYAELIFANGLGLEHGPSLRSYLDNNERVVKLGDRIAESNPELILYVDGLPDPHIWTAVSMWRRIVPFVVEGLQSARPEAAEIFAERGRAVAEEMERVNAQITAQLQAVPDGKRYLVTSHDAFNYFTRHYLAAPNEISPEAWDKRFEAPEGLAPEAQLSPIDIERIIDHMDRYRVTVLFSESNVSQDSIQKIVHAGRERGLDLYVATTPLYGDAMGGPGSAGDSYLKMAKHNADTIARHLQDAAVPVANGDHKSHAP